MDNKNHFTVVLPLSDMELAMLQRESNLTDLRAALWNRAADAMKPLLDRICSRISPAALPGLLAVPARRSAVCQCVLLRPRPVLSVLLS